MKRGTIEHPSQNARRVRREAIAAAIDARIDAILYQPSKRDLREALAQAVRNTAALLRESDEASS